MHIFENECLEVSVTGALLQMRYNFRLLLLLFKTRDVIKQQGQTTKFSVNSIYLPSLYSSQEKNPKPPHHSYGIRQPITQPCQESN